jgi:hypothetical protein
MNNQLTFIRVYSLGYEGVGKGIAKPQQYSLIKQVRKEVSV